MNQLKRLAGAGRGLRAALKGVVIGVCIVAAVASLAVVGLAGKPVLDDARLDWIVLAVVLDWRDFGHQAAQQRLQYELDHQQIDLAISENDCVFDLHPSGTREVRCEWQTPINLPFIGVYHLPFSSVGRLSDSGGLVRRGG